MFIVLVCVVSYEYRWQGQFLAQTGQGSLPGAQTHKEPPSSAPVCLGAAAEDTAQCSQGQSVQPDTLLLPGLALSRIWGFFPIRDYYYLQVLLLHFKAQLRNCNIFHFSLGISHGTGLEGLSGGTRRDLPGGKRDQ